LKDIHHIVTTDNGGGPHYFFEFWELIIQQGYLLQPTAPDAPFQNGIAEGPNQTFGNMMRSLLLSASLPLSFGPMHSFTLLNLKTCYHMLLLSYFLYTGEHPTAGNLCIFGCRVYIQLPGECRHKLVNHATTGIFLGYTAMIKNIMHYDLVTKCIKTTTHVIFDEADMMATEKDRPRGIQCLYSNGLY
jgi:hypothetical protein